MEDDSTSIALLVFALIALVPMYGFFVLASVAVRRSRVRHLNEACKGKFGSAIACKISDRPDPYLLAAQAGMYISALSVGLLIVTLMYSERAWTMADRLSGRFELSLFALAAGLVVITSFVAIACVQVLKAIALANPERTLCAIAYPLDFVAKMLWPLLALLNYGIAPLLQRLGLSLPVERDRAVSAEDISELVEHSSAAGGIEEEEGELIMGVIEFSDTVVREVMTPRQDVIAIQDSATLEEIKTIFTSQGISRLVVYGDELDDVKGILLAKDLIAFAGIASPDFDLKPLLRKAFTVSGGRKLDDVLHEFRRHQTHFAIVLDEHGGVDGVVTVEDLLEEIVGDIFDEFDDPEKEVTSSESPSGDVFVDGSIVIDEVNESFGLDLPENGAYDTLAGFVIQTLGRIPEVGEKVDVDGGRVVVAEVVQNRVTRLKIVGADGTRLQNGTSQAVAHDD